MRNFIIACLMLSTIPAVLAQTSYTFTGKPIFDIDARRNSVSLGTIKLELFPNIAPLHARSFDSLVSVKFYDTTAFYRVIPGFVIQGGDPNSRHGPTSTWGLGDPSQPTVPAEFSVARHVRGILSAARKANDINSYTSQFFICVATAANLNGQYSIFGRVLAGMDVVDTIVNAPRNLSNNMPLQKIEMFVTRNGSNDTVPLSPPQLLPAPNATFAGAQSFVQLKWDRVTDAQLYELQVSRDSTFADTMVMQTLYTLSYNFPNVPDTSTFFWRVRANNGGHFSPWAQGRFSTVDIYVGLSSHPAPAPVVVFPNPSSGQFTFSNLVPGEVVRIYDAGGKLVRTYRTNQSAIQVDLGDCAPGSYIYTIGSPGEKREGGSLLVE